MYLKKLEINGFKSFANKTLLEFKSQISGVVGPNGSGKSNVVEAFRFVLGEQSMKNMRGKKGEDLIFSGKKGRLNRASVKVVFDNKDGKFDFDYDEVVLERVVYRDGSNEYLINNTKVRAKDILDLLSSVNIGASGHHIISQGEADRILIMNAKDRKNLIEEALGLKSYLFKKQESEKKLEKVENNLKEVKTRERVNYPRIKFLEKEVEKIKNNKNLKEELFFLYSLFFPKKKEYLSELDNFLLKKEEKEKEKNILFSKIEEKKKELEKKNFSGDLSLKTEIEKIKKEILEIEEKKKELEKKIARNEVFIESELAKKREYDEQKNKVEENLNFYNKKFSEIENIFQKYDFKTDNQLLRKIIEEILLFFGFTKEGRVLKNFNLEEVEKRKKENESLVLEINNFNSFLESLNSKLRIINSDNENKNEILNQETKIEILKLEKILSEINSELNNLNNKIFNLKNNLNIFEKEELYFVNFFSHEDLEKIYLSPKKSDEKNLLEKITKIRIILENNSVLNENKIIEEYEELKARQEFVLNEVKDLEKSRNDLLVLIKDLNDEIERRFRKGIEKINSEFDHFFKILFSGGSAELRLIEIPLKNDNEESLKEFDLGVDIKVSLPNKKVSGLSMLSGGERSLTSIALLFAMSSITPPPFIILDETDAALDEANSKRYGDMIESLSKHSQLILVTHNRETMSRAGLLYGVSMNESGMSKLLSVSFEEGQKYAK